MPVFRLTDELIFPPPELARDDGLLAVGGDLSPERLLLAYSMGIFPWYGPGEPILWWAPSPRLILLPAEFHLPRRLARKIRQGLFSVSLDSAFQRVIEACAMIRTARNEPTWIDRQMIEAYTRLHELGYAHSVECWQGGDLVGGLYGVSLGSAFFGESMFSTVTDSSKVALATLVDFLQKRSFDLIDCQIATAHLERFGAREISGQEFQARLAACLDRPTSRGRWRL